MKIRWYWMALRKLRGKVQTNVIIFFFLQEQWQKKEKKSRLKNCNVNQAILAYNFLFFCIIFILSILSCGMDSAFNLYCEATTLLDFCLSMLKASKCILLNSCWTIYQYREKWFYTRKKQLQLSCFRIGLHCTSFMSTFQDTNSWSFTKWHMHTHRICCKYCKWYFLWVFLNWDIWLSKERKKW